jgi:D-lactate dehydrogenase (cytochrome)
VDRNRPEEIAEAERLNDRLVKRALAMGGTSTGEHGIGSGKMKYLQAEHGAEGVEFMRLLKRSIDPNNIMNPGKIVSSDP